MTFISTFGSICPSDNPECTPQPPRPADDGCGKELDYWFTEADPPSQAVAGAAEAAARPRMADSAGRLPPRAVGAIGRRSIAARFWLRARHKYLVIPDEPLNLDR